MTIYARTPSPLGELLLVGEESAEARDGVRLSSLSMPEQRGAVRVRPGWRRADEAFAGAVRQLREYFEGRRKDFELDFGSSGTAFQEQVWSAVEAIPYSATVSYGELSRQCGISSADVRAVGTAVGANPLLLVRPCHRVIGADGAMRGYAAGIPRKEALLTLEGALQPRLV